MELLIVSLIVVFILTDPTQLPNFIRQAKIGMAYKCKYIASHAFLSPEMSSERVESAVEFPPLHLIKTKVDTQAKSVKASLLGKIGKKEAFYYSAGKVEGCVFDKESIGPLIKSPPGFPVQQSQEDIKWHFDEQFHNVPENVDSRTLNEVIHRAMALNPEICAITIASGNEVVAESYNKGVNRDTRILGWSMTKTMGNALMGVLHNQGRVVIDSTAGIDVWKSQSDLRHKITINDLLQMQSGLRWTEDYEAVSDVTRMLYLENDCYKYAINCPLDVKTLRNDLSNRFNYSSGTSNILSGIIKREIVDFDEYVRFPFDQLFDPLGMDSAVIEMDSAGTYVLSSYGWATARDWTRFGLLYLYEGDWFGKRIFNKEWSDYTRRPAAFSNGEYGAHVWLNGNNEKGERRFPSVPPDAYYEEGFGGQQIMIIPSRNLVITTLCGIMSDENFPTFFNNFYANVLACFE